MLCTFSGEMSSAYSGLFGAHKTCPVLDALIVKTKGLHQTVAIQQITLAPTVTPDPNIVLYYNPDGGSYYHTDPDCTSIGAKYRPLTASFRYSQLNEEKYKNLKPCGECNAPAR